MKIIDPKKEMMAVKSHFRTNQVDVCQDMGSAERGMHDRVLQLRKYRNRINCEGRIREYIHRVRLDRLGQGEIQVSFNF